jgi:hypothetical protein
MHMQAQHWLGQLANEMHTRLQEDHEEHCRRATRLILYIGCSGAILWYLGVTFSGSQLGYGLLVGSIYRSQYTLQGDAPRTSL